MKEKKESSKMSREAKTSRVEGEMECSLFEWLSDFDSLSPCSALTELSLLVYRSGTGTENSAESFKV